MGNGLFAVIAGHNFGIYLVYPLVIDVLRKLLGSGWSAFGAATSAPLVSTLAVAISLASGAALSKDRCLEGS